MVKDLYKQKLMEHYHQSPHRGAIEGAEVISQTYDPSCGDEITLFATITDNHLSRVAFEGKGCIISQAAASLLCEFASGKRVDEIQQLRADDMSALLGIPLGPIRLKCAMLALQALQQGVADFIERTC